MNSESLKPHSKRIYIIVQLISVIISLGLFFLIYGETGTEIVADHWSKALPDLNAFLNTLTTCLLIFGYINIKKGNKETHIKFMLTATLMSALFLGSYVTYHFYQGDTKFLGTGLIRPIYFSILITHVLLSIINLPMILLTLWFALTKDLERHKKFAKITFPIWLYVSVSGVLVYLFLKFQN
jgi:putative membrane protein